MEEHRDDELPPPYTPQEISDILPIYSSDSDARHIHTYALRQTSPDTQTLSLCGDASTPPIYHIKTFKTGGFMNRKPHVRILRDPKDKVSMSEGRFDIHGTGTTITYADPPSAQRLELMDSRMQILKTTICGMDRWWQPFPGNKDVIELSNDVDDTIARFLSTAEPSTLSNIIKKKPPEIEVGKLHVVDAFVSSEEERIEILCSAIVVVERQRRRAAILNNKSSAYGVVRSMSASSGSHVP